MTTRRTLRPPLVLATTDGSRRSWRALPHAAHLARAIGGEVLLLRVLDPTVDCAHERAATSAEATERVRARWTRDLERRTTDLGVPASARVAVKGGGDDVSDVILQTTAETKAGLVAMTTRGAGFVRGVVLGSVATGVMRHAAVPLMLAGNRVRPTTGELPYRLVVTTDGSEAAASALPDLRRLLAQAPRETVHLTLLRVHRPSLGEPDRESLGAKLRRDLLAFGRQAPRGFERDTDLREDDRLGGADRGIREAAAAHQADGIWMSTHGDSFRRQLLLGSVALATVDGADMPVILTRANR